MSALPTARVPVGVEIGATTTMHARELLVIDGRLAFAGELARGARATIELLVLDPSRDGIVQISEALRGRSDITAVHLVGRGAPGRVLLGGSELSLDTLPRYREHLGAWFGESTPFEPRPEILLYGCRVGEGAVGERFLDELAMTARAEVAGSDDLTGASSEGGDFELEVRTGAIAALFPLDRTLAERVFGTLELE
ncbi:MAG: DUF4347 domain-containing protein [Polyangiaceae bacterium]|nr:DUF4347 domain-containing protein [Polyangiaceae bacterium]